jgi:hypothetical protein
MVQGRRPLTHYCSPYLYSLQGVTSGKDAVDSMTNRRKSQSIDYPLTVAPIVLRALPFLVGYTVWWTWLCQIKILGYSLKRYENKMNALGPCLLAKELPISRASRSYNPTISTLETAAATPFRVITASLSQASRRVYQKRDIHYNITWSYDSYK